MKSKKITLLCISSIVILTFLSCNKKVLTSSNDENKQKIQHILSSKSWNWKHKGCTENQQRFSFIDNKMIIKYDTPVKRQNLDKYVSSTEYILLKAIKNGFRTQIVDEYRKDNNGKLVKWDIIIENDSTFYWRRSDWSIDSFTKPLVACN